MASAHIPEIWVWAEYFCPWCYISTVRLRQIEPEYESRVRVRIREFPLELFGRQAAPRVLLSEEWWVAAVQEPAARFSAFTHDDWPTSTMPAFIAVRAVRARDEALARVLDFRIREAFFAESRNIGKPDVILDLVREVGGDVASVQKAFSDEAVRAAIVAEWNVGRKELHVRGTPTLMLEDGTRLHLPIAEPHAKDGRIVSIEGIPCVGEACRQATRQIFEQALAQPPRNA